MFFQPIFFSGIRNLLYALRSVHRLDNIFNPNLPKKMMLSIRLEQYVLDLLLFKQLKTIFFLGPR